MWSNILRSVAAISFHSSSILMYWGYVLTFSGVLSSWLLTVINHQYPALQPTSQSMFKQQQRSKYTVKWLWWCLQKTMKWFLWTPRIKACVYLFRSYIKSKHSQGLFIAAVFIPIVSFSFGAGRVILMLSGFVLFSVEVVCVGSWPVTLISHPLFITLALSKCLICHEWMITGLLKRVLAGWEISHREITAQHAAI